MSIDIKAVSGIGKKNILRIIASPVPDEVANVRRMKAKKEAKGRTCSYEYLQLLGWNIFITAKQACLLYGLRWRIKCIFKTWKSNFNFDKVHNVSQIQLRVLLYARFIMITLFYERLYKPLETIVSIKHAKQLSLMIFMRYMSRNFAKFVEQFFNLSKRDVAIYKIVLYCSYEKRNRINFIDLAG